MGKSTVVKKRVVAKKSASVDEVKSEVPEKVKKKVKEAVTDIREEATKKMKDKVKVKKAAEVVEEKVEEAKPEKVVGFKLKEIKRSVNMEGDINEDSGSRFPLNSARQLAFEIILKNVKDGKTAKQIREALMLSRKENGFKYNLDAGYLNFVVASHPEYFKYYKDGKIELLQEPAIKVKSDEVVKKEKVKEMRKSAKKVKKLRSDKA